MTGMRLRRRPAGRARLKACITPAIPHPVIGPIRPSGRGDLPSALFEGSPPGTGIGCIRHIVRGGEPLGCVRHDTNPPGRGNPQPGHARKRATAHPGRHPSSGGFHRGLQSPDDRSAVPGPRGAARPGGHHAPGAVTRDLLRPGHPDVPGSGFALFRVTSGAPPRTSPTRSAGGVRTWHHPAAVSPAIGERVCAVRRPPSSWRRGHAVTMPDQEAG